MNGIPMTPSNHQLIRDLKKTETRRLTGLGKVNEEPDKWKIRWELADGRFSFQYDNNPSMYLDIKPRFHEGEEVYIKEAHYAYGHWAQFNESGKLHWEFFREPGTVIHFADKIWQHALTKPSQKKSWYKRSPLFLEADLARDFLLMLKVFPQRARDITPAQAVMEGFSTPEAWGAEINACNLKAKPWDNNLWLFVFQFRLIKKDGVEL